MGRELKRVPLNFEWELDKLWSGYVNPHSYHKCKHCDGTGYSKEYQKLKDEWYSFENELRLPNPFKEGYSYNSLALSHNLTQEDVQALLDGNRLWDFTRVPLTKEHEDIIEQRRKEGKNSWLPFNNGYVPTAKEVNEWSLKSIIGHDDINCFIVVEARLKKQGILSECGVCKGSGSNWQSEKAKLLYESWENYDPPIGEGFQLWTTTNEGAPMSPVFDSLENLCDFLERDKVSLFGSNTATKEEWFNMLSDGVVAYREGNKVFM